MPRKKKVASSNSEPKPKKNKKKKPEVDDIRDAVQKGIAAGSQVANTVFDIIKLFS